MNSDSFMADKNYVKWLSDLKKRFCVAQLKAAVKVNTEMLKFYWSLLFYSSQIDFLYQAGTKLQKVDNATIPMPEILLFVPWRHQTVIVSKCDTINAALFYLNKVVEDNMSRTEFITNHLRHLRICVTRVSSERKSLLNFLISQK